MKVRWSYVSNSSSSSFVVKNYSKIDKGILDKIFNYDKACLQHCKDMGYKIEVMTDYKGEAYQGYDLGFDGNGYQYWVKEGSELLNDNVFNDECRWNIEINKEEDKIYFDTIMNNFDMVSWLEVLGVEIDDLDDDDW